MGLFLFNSAPSYSRQGKPSSSKGMESRSMYQIVWELDIGMKEEDNWLLSALFTKSQNVLCPVEWWRTMKLLSIKICCSSWGNKSISVVNTNSPSWPSQQMFKEASEIGAGPRIELASVCWNTIIVASLREYEETSGLHLLCYSTYSKWTWVTLSPS